MGAARIYSGGKGQPESLLTSLRLRSILLRKLFNAFVFRAKEYSLKIILIVSLFPPFSIFIFYNIRGGGADA
jgi:hypothetical protein